MYELFSRALRKTVSEHEFRLFARDSKPSALRGRLFSDHLLADWPNILQSSNLHWLFESTRTGQPVGNVDEALPEHRGRLSLTDETAKILQEDLAEINIHGFRRFVALYGGSEELLKLTNDESLHDAVEAFASGQPSPLKLLLLQFGDVSPDYIYLNLDHVATFRTLLSNLNVPPLAEIPKAKYRDLKGEELEVAVTYLSCAEHDH